MKRIPCVVLAAVTPVVSLFYFGGPLEAQEKSAGVKRAIETAGGTLGSLAGLGAASLILDRGCPEEEVSCNLHALGGAFFFLTVQPVAGAVGTWALGRAAGTGPSLEGAGLGSLVGTAAALFLANCLFHSGDAAVIGFGVSQGIITSLGSRIGAAARR